MKEKQLELKVHAALDADGYLTFKNQGNLYSGDGRPDLEALKGGQLYGVELKAGTGHHLSLIQLWTLLKLSRAGAKCLVAFPDLLDTSMLAVKNAITVPVASDKLDSKSPAQAGIETVKLLTKVAGQVDHDKKSVWISWKNA